MAQQFYKLTSNNGIVGEFTDKAIAEKELQNLINNGKGGTITTIRKYSIYAYENDTIFIWSNFSEKNFTSMPDVNDDNIVVITNAYNTNITIYNVAGFSDEEILDVIDRHISDSCFGSNYKYKLVKRIGNTFFLN